VKIIIRCWLTRAQKYQVRIKYREVISSGWALCYSYVIVNKKSNLLRGTDLLCYRFRIVRARKRTFSLTALHQLHECKSSFNNTRYLLIIQTGETSPPSSGEKWIERFTPTCNIKYEEKVVHSPEKVSRTTHFLTLKITANNVLHVNKNICFFS